MVAMVHNYAHLPQKNATSQENDVFNALLPSLAALAATFQRCSFLLLLLMNQSLRQR